MLLPRAAWGVRPPLGTSDAVPLLSSSLAGFGHGQKWLVLLLVSLVTWSPGIR